MRKILYILSMIILVNTAPLLAAEITFDSPSGGFTTHQIYQISGSVTGYSKNRCTLVINGIPQTVPLMGNGRFEINAVAAPGLNTLEMQAGETSKKVSFYAKVPAKDIKVLLTWDTPTDIDLWVIDPTGFKCYYADRSSPSGGNLDTDVTSGFGPETFTMSKALPGTYSVQIQYYSSGDAPVTRVNVYLILHEGTPNEKRQQYQFVMTRSSQVYHITDFQIEE